MIAMREIQRSCEAIAAAFKPRRGGEGRFVNLARRRAERGTCLVASVAIACPRMSATLTINLDSDVLQLAEQEAWSRHTTLPEVIAQQLRVMARNWQDSRAGKTPVTDALRGAVKLPPDFDERMALTEELQKRHGVQG